MRLFSTSERGILFTTISLKRLHIKYPQVIRLYARAVQDLFGCFFAFFLAFLLTNYAAHVFTERMVTGYFIVAIGLLVVANTAVSVLSSRHKQNMI